MDSYRQGNPYCVQIELTEGCNLRCPFCGLNGIRGKDNDYKYMTLETAMAIASDMSEFMWNSRIEFAMHGEPTMNPYLFEIIKTFRKMLPNSYLLMESNGGGLLRDPVRLIEKLFRSGLTTLALDEYQQVKLVEKIFAKLFPDPSPLLGNGNQYFAGAQVWDYPTFGKGGNPHQRNKKTRLIRVRPIDVSTSGTHSSLNNHGGAGAPPNNKASGRRCAKPFREISFRWDGGVAVCCNDWRGELPIGNVNEQSISEIWHSDVFYAARRKLYAGERDFGACNGCDAISYRTGILPDRLGKEELLPPTLYTNSIIERAMKKGPMTKPVLRPWETEI